MSAKCLNGKINKQKLNVYIHIGYKSFTINPYRYVLAPVIYFASLINSPKVISAFLDGMNT